MELQARDETPGIVITLSAAAPGEELRRLHVALLEDERLSDVTPLHKPLLPGRMGPELWGLHLSSLRPDDVAALLYAVATWLRHRTGDIKVTFEQNKDGRKITVDATRVRKDDRRELRETLRTLAGDLLAPPDGTAPAAGPGGQTADTPHHEPARTAPERTGAENASRAPGEG
ncbi:hypothetical protein OHB00_02525 [Streptomyces sp. NBC_00631]|uniref:effector-associated constant component EACC1 n=1 Tax=Streptomyces sp. NBC_00631 TaxID=2975793 RepID=UPI0030E2CA2B